MALRIKAPAGLVAGLFFLLAAMLPARLLAVPEIQHWRTSDGAEVYFVQAPQIPMVDIRVVFNAGAARDGDRPGIGVLTNALLAEGAGGMSADTIAERFASVGAEFSNDSLRDMAIVSLRSLTDPDRLKPALETFAAVVGSPDFPERAFERERARVLVALERVKQQPGEIAERDFYRALYGDHPYATPVLGTEASVKAMTPADLKAHYERFYVAKNAVIAIVGDLDREAAAGLAERAIAGLDPGEPAPPLPSPVPLRKAQRVDEAHPSSQTHIWIGELGVARGDDEWFALYVGNHILGGSGLVSRISDEVREERGLAYSAYSYFAPMQVRGPFVAGLQTANRNAEEASRVLRETLERFVSEGPTADEVEAAKKNITGGFALEVDSNSEIVGFLGSIGFYDLPLDYLARYIDRIEAVTPEAIKRAFQRHLHPDTMLTVTVGGANGEG